VIHIKIGGSNSVFFLSTIWTASFHVHIYIGFHLHLSFIWD
jgi:hypothetical protein